MKFLHTSDLHIGKTIYEFSMIEEQKHIVAEIIQIAKKEKVDAVLIAGDIYDRSIPSTEAVGVLNDFLTELIQEKIKVFLISGNHDSAERVQFANQILEKQGLTIVGSLENGQARQVFLEDEFGKVGITLLPFVKPSQVGAGTSQEAVEIIRSNTPFDKDARNICMTHYFVTNHGKYPETSDSETNIQIGGLDHVEAELFSDFDYVALGHIHKAQKIGEGEIYYSGTPLKYSFSEAMDDKTVTIVEMKEKGNLTIRKCPLHPKRDMRRIKGTLEALLQKEVVESGNREDYIEATLLDKEELIDPIGTLRSVYPNTMHIILAKNAEKESSLQEEEVLEQNQKKSMEELFGDFYELVRGEELDEERKEAVLEIIKETQI